MGESWRISLTLPSANCLPLFEAALEGMGGAVSAIEIDADRARGSGLWRLTGYISSPPDGAELEARLALAAAGAGIDPPPCDIERLEDRDWVAAAERERKPIDAGRFFVYPSHHGATVPEGGTAIDMDASMAFGSGEHATTRGCLIALDRLLRERTFERALDMGAGSAILAIALAKTSDADILAADIDPVSVAIAAENAVLNGVGARIRCLQSDGFDSSEIAAGGPYDLIFANILAQPLIEMAPDLVSHLSPGGVAVLSGYLTDQAPTVAAAYEESGAPIVDRIDIDDWVTLVVRRG
jgi:ribosomal protein L11 methyltransferase